MAYIPDAPVFANRYRFEPVGDDWDRGRSGYTHLVYDLKTERRGVIKRAEINSKQAVDGLKNEAGALKTLKGLGVPEVYDIGQTVYGSKNYFYMVIEYIDGMRVERNLGSLNVSERAEILTQFFGLLAQAHRWGIVNGDVDLKHLFWRRDTKQLRVIDWGNAKLGVDPKKKTEFAYDLARAAEIIFSLVTHQGHPPATGSIALPSDATLISGLAPLPIEFRELCQWAPRTPIDGAQAPHTASELFEVSKKWLAAIKNARPFQSTTPTRKRTGLVLIPIFLVAVALFLAVTKFKSYFIPTPTTTSTAVPLTSTNTSLIPSNTPVFTETTSPATVTPTEIVTPIVSTPETPTSTTTIIPAPLAYSSPILVFDNNLNLQGTLRKCWRKAISPSDLKEREAFYRRGDEDWWLFSIAKERASEQPVQVDFSECLNQQPVDALALNALVTRLEPERVPLNALGTYEPGREFGFFLESQNAQRREYTLWIDKNDKMHLRVRENGNIISDDTVQIINKLEHGGIEPYIFDRFPVQIFVEVDNQGFDIIYLFEAPAGALESKDIDPSQMTRIDTVARPTLGNIQKIGLVGYGGQTDVLIWPLVFFPKP